jgi:thiosulfate/3-mercaptopyruvate sulfurtransferase
MREDAIMSYAHPEALASTDWLAAHLSDPKVKVLDASYHLPNVDRDADAEFLAKRIPGAVRFDIDDICDPDDALPHMIPSPARFAEKVAALGISSGDRVVIYDCYGMQSAARGWWMFRVFGHDDVAVLDGGLPKWLAEDRPTESGPRPHPAEGAFDATFRPELVRDRDDIRANIDSKKAQVVDARAAGRYAGTDPEPRAGMRSGHIPGSVSLPFQALLDPKDKTFLPADSIQAAIGAAGLDLGKPVTASCGSGVTACILALGAHLVGKSDVAVYDGSWSDWGSRDDTPIETGGV